MKASIKFRADQKPILRGKVPLNILGFPFQSGIEAGDAKDLCLNFATFFEFGPLFKLSYRPNDAFRPFGFSVRTGVGKFGSPLEAPMTMTAEFNFPGNGNPCFFLRFRPQIGDFSIKRSVDSPIALPAQASVSTPKFRSNAIGNDGDSENEEFFENNETPVIRGGDKAVNGLVFSRLIRNFPTESAVERLYSGVELHARTALPLRDRAALKLRWSIRLPTDEVGDRSADNWFRRAPCLVLSKIGVEHVATAGKDGQESKLNKKDDVAKACLAVKRELDVLQEESGLLRKGLDKLRSEIDAGKIVPVAGARISGRISEFEGNGEKFRAGKNKAKERKSLAGENCGVKVLPLQP